MRISRAILTVSTLGLLMGSAAITAAPYAAFDPRSLGMGGAGVAAGTSANAVFLNPSLLAVKRSEKFSLDLPVGARLSDPGNLLDAVDGFKNSGPVTDFRNAIEAYQADGNATNTAAVEDTGDALMENLQSISGKAMQAEGNGAVVVGVPGETLGFSVFANAYVIGGTVGRIGDEDLNAIQQAIDAADGGSTVTDPTDSLTSSVDARFATVAETGVGLATRFESLGGLAVGITPKFVQVSTYDYSFSGADLDEASIDLDEGKHTENNFNVDIGLAKEFQNSWLVGLSVRNLVSKEYRTVQNNIFKIEPQARIGLAYHREWLTIAGDLDVTENEPAGFESKTRYAIVGGEFDLLRTFQLRLGYRHNLSTMPAGQEPGIFSAGLGFSPFGAHLDAAVAGNSDEIGGALQLGYRF